MVPLPLLFRPRALMYLGQTDTRCQGDWLDLNEAKGRCRKGRLHNS